MKIISAIFYPLIFLSYCYLIPNSIFELNEIKNLLKYFGEYFQTFENFNKHSKYPELYSFAILIGFILLPVQMFLFNLSGGMNGTDKWEKKQRVKGLIGALMIMLLAFFLLVFYFGGDIEGNTNIDRLTRNVLTNKIWFSLFFGLIFQLLGACISAFFSHALAVLKFNKTEK